MPKDDKRPPAFMLYVNDFCSDGIVEAMTTEEVGAYFLLLCKAWLEEPCGTIPDDDKILARWARLTPQRWAKCKPAIMPAFKLLADGRLHQSRMKKEYMKWLMREKDKSIKARKGAAARWGDANALPTHDSGIASVAAKSMPNDAISISNSNSISNSVDVDVDGAINLSFSENARAKANRLSKLISCTLPDARSLVAKVAILWDAGELSEDAVEQAIESFGKSQKRIGNPAGWFYTCLANQCRQRDLNFEQLLKTTPLPIGVLANGGHG